MRHLVILDSLECLERLDLAVLLVQVVTQDGAVYQEPMPQVDTVDSQVFLVTQVSLGSLVSVVGADILDLVEHPVRVVNLGTLVIQDILVGLGGVDRKEQMVNRDGVDLAVLLVHLVQVVLLELQDSLDGVATQVGLDSPEFQVNPVGVDKAVYLELQGIPV
jgi:hypothetical protein